MKWNYLLLLAAAALLPWATGCPKPANEKAATDEHAEHEGEEHGEHEGEEHGHSHGEEDDGLVWHLEELPHGDYTIALGQHGAHLHAGEKGEPAVIITKGGESVADAKVFVTILDEAGTAELAAEKEGAYETVEGEPPHYAVLFEKIPDAKGVTLSYRIVLPDGTEFKKTAAAEVEKH